MPDVLAIASSPRKSGNSEILLDSCLEGVARAGMSFEKVRICELKISPCLNCGGCEHTGVCVIDDDMQMLHRKFSESNILIVSSPVFFMGLPAQLKAAVDRCQAIWVRKYLLRRRMPDLDARRALFIQIGGMKKGKVFEGGLATITAFFATLDYAFFGKLLLNDIDARGAVKSHPTALAQARWMGLEIAHGNSEDAPGPAGQGKPD
ncbi:MAG: flavodoxin family protein [Candidatus Hydrogenedentota bacterium]|nr:MAG: flavodoxin family protein [Candidatus Hydrogenedentota bacterium]